MEEERTIYIPVIDTYSQKFEYNGRELTQEELCDMFYEHFKRTNKSVDAFVHGSYVRYDDDNVVPTDVANAPDFKFVTHEVKAYLRTTNGENVTDGTLLRLVDTGKMGIMILDINPSEVEYDPFTELKLWKTDSSNILLDKDLPDKTKITSLPKRDIYFIVNNRALRIHNTKIIEIYKDKNRPFKFAIMFEKITY